MFSPHARGCSGVHCSTSIRICVFPACAGMFRPSTPGRALGPSFPRMRGDVPDSYSPCTGLPVFSPHARGCSALRGGLDRALVRFPRMRGDVPRKVPQWKPKTTFSPHARGCSSPEAAKLLRAYVFPACAGMFLEDVHGKAIFPRFPRMRGDVPVRSMIPAWAWGFSPHARGCSGVAVRRLGGT